MWQKVDTVSGKYVASPRIGHTGWEYNRMLWVFGSYGPSSAGYLNGNGSFSHGYNNQLLSFNPSIGEWKDWKCFGSVPTPRTGHAMTIIKDKAWGTIFRKCVLLRIIPA